MVSGRARAPTAGPTGRLPAIDVDLSSVAWRGLCAFVFSIPFSIFVAQLLLILTAVAAVADWRACGRPRLRTPLDLPIACFLATALLASLLGLYPSDSLYGLRTYLQVVIVYLVYAYARDLERSLALVRAFLAGAAITAAYALLGAALPSLFPRLFLGQMTQSGQLLFALSFALPLLLRGVFPARWLRPGLALFVAALVVNLKRGVWLGVIASVMTVGLLASRRLLLAAGLVVVLTATVVPPVRTRITNSARDLSLPGNRFDIWLAAIDVVKRFPMGVGRKNGEILRDYPNIPQHHKHAHNNPLQITLESGFLGLAAFLWWMGRFAWLSWRAMQRISPSEVRLRAVAVGVFASFVGFHVAGLVEYNFGDSEVLEIFFVTMGLGLVVDEIARRDG
jgi:O-antigen ligase